VGWIGNWRRELLDLVIALNEEHLRRLIRDYVRYNLSGQRHLVCRGATRIDGGARPGAAAKSGWRRRAGFVSTDRRFGVPSVGFQSLPDDVPRVRPGRLRRPHGLWRIYAVAVANEKFTIRTRPGDHAIRRDLSPKITMVVGSTVPAPNLVLANSCMTWLRFLSTALCVQRSATGSGRITFVMALCIFHGERRRTHHGVFP
jgi:hypothetical protein